MANEKQPKLVTWNLRKFPENVKLECQSRAARERKTDPQFVAECVRLAFRARREKLGKKQEQLD